MRTRALRAFRAAVCAAFAAAAVIAVPFRVAGATTDYRWQQLSITGPGSRTGASGAYLPQTRQSVVFGGCSAFRSATLTVSFSNGEQTLFGGSWCDAADAPRTTWALGDAWSQVGGSGPPPRWLAGMAYDANAKALVLFGGTIATHQNVGLIPTPPSPDAVLCVHGPAAPDAILISPYDTAHFNAGITSMTYPDPTTGSLQALYIWCYQDTWTLRYDAGSKRKVWSKQNPAHHPRARFDFSIGSDGLGRATLDDGCTAQGFIEQEDSAGKSSGYRQWDCYIYRYFKYPTGAPPPAYEYQETNYVRDTWHYQSIGGSFDWVRDIAESSSAWLGNCKDSRSPAPDCVRGAGGTFDPATQTFTNAGGWLGTPGAYSTQGSFARLNYWNASAWLTSGALPSPRSWSMAAYAWINSAWSAVVFGGYSGGVLLNDTVALTGGACPGSSCAIAPPPRYSGVLTYDAKRQRLVLYGGFNGAALGDTWIMPAPVPGTAPPACVACP
jgi:hypothetical protein